MESSGTLQMLAISSLRCCRTLIRLSAALVLMLAVVGDADAYDCSIHVDESSVQEESLLELAQYLVDEVACG